MKPLEWVGVGALAVMGANWLGKAAYNQIQIEPGKAHIDTTMLPQFVRINWEMAITNNNPVGATVHNVVGEVFYGDVSVGNVSVQTPVTLTPGQKKTFVVNFTINAVQLITDVIGSLANNGIFSTLVNKIRFKGTVYTNVINVPIDTFIRIV